jgi:transposase
MRSTWPLLTLADWCTAHIRLRLTRRQTARCYGLLRAAGDVWAWLLDSNRQRHQQGERPVTSYQALCRELTKVGAFGELSMVSAQSVLRRYADAWFQTAKRRKTGGSVSFPRRKRGLVPVRWYQGTFAIQGQRVRLPVAQGRPELWVRLARPLPYPPEQVRAVMLFADGERLWLAVTAAVPIQPQYLDAGRVAGVDLGVIHPYGDPKGITKQDAGRVQNWRLRQWRRTHLLQALRDKAERGTSSTCPVCQRRVPKPPGRGFHCPHCGLKGHRDLVGAANIAAKAGGGSMSTGLPCSSSTVAPASCRHGVTAAATSTTNGSVGPAWPRATHPRMFVRLGVARQTQSPILRVARIKRGRLARRTLLEGALAVSRHAWVDLLAPGVDPACQAADPRPAVGLQPDRRLGAARADVAVDDHVARGGDLGRGTLDEPVEADVQRRLDRRHRPLGGGADVHQQWRVVVGHGGGQAGRVHLLQQRVRAHPPAPSSQQSGQ